MRSLLFLLVLAVLPACSCDSERDGMPAGGAGGSGGAGGEPMGGASGMAPQPDGGPSGVGGDELMLDAGPDAEIDASLPMPKDAIDACFTLMLARENRIQRTCQGLPPASAVAFTGCPGVLLAPGSPFDYETLLGCIEAWHTFDCERALNHESPDGCAFAGDRAEGETCYMDVQCASGRCSRESPSCSVCARIAEQDERCDVHGVGCPLGMYCGPEGTCIDEQGYALAETQPLGSECYTDADCGTNFDFEYSDPRCAYPDGDRTAQPRCAAVPTVGEPCLLWHLEPDVYICVDGYCDAEHMCQPLPVDGEPCWDSGVSVGSCALGFYCEPSSLLCRPFKARGESCSTAGEAFECGYAPYNPVQKLNACSCEDASCDALRCTEARVLGERCDEPDTFCEYPAVCESGTCVRGPDFDLACVPD